MQKAANGSVLVVAIILASFAAAGCAPEPFVPGATACRALLGSRLSGHAGRSATRSPSAPGYGTHGSSGRSDRDRRAARKLLAKGIDRYNEGDFRGAIRAFADSHEREPSKDSTLYAARSFRQLQCDSEARDLYRSALASFPGEVRADERAEAQGFVNPPPPPPSKDQIAKAKAEAAERAARQEAARLEAERRAREERERHDQACNAVRSHSERGDLTLLQQKAQSCPEALTDTQRAWLAEHGRSLEMTRRYEKALSGSSEDMKRFYFDYYDTGDPRVEEIRKLAEGKFGPANPAQYKRMRKRLEATSTPSFSVTLCDISGDTAKVLLSITNYTAAVGLGSLLTGSGGDFLVRAARAQKISQDSTIRNAKHITGAKNIELYSNCNSPHWYLSDRPWPPKKEQKK